LFLNKHELFSQKITHLDIKNFFPDYKGESGDVATRLDYFKMHFTWLAQKTGRSKECEVYIQYASVLRG
jgi:guanine nucleotide-binding protein subunit alpha, other